MRSTWFTRGARAVLALAAVAVVVGVTPAAAKPKPGVKRTSSNLFALTAAIEQVNHQYCPVINTGLVCTDPSGNGVIEGGFWPKGTPDSYIFNSGLQIAGTVDLAAGIPWAGDTTGVFFMDPRGDQSDGSPITLVYNSLDAGDQSAWPTPEGRVADTSVYNAVLIGRNSVSQQDLWFRAWDGNPTRLGGRAHPMGIAVDARVMGWNFPTGNEDIIYAVFTFTNVTSSVAADYDNPTSPSHDPQFLNDMAALGAQFQQLNQTKYGFAFPQHGFAFDSVFANYFQDCDVGTDHVAQNYSTPVFPFNMGVCWEAPFNEVSWTAAGSFNPSIFTPPTFFVGPGLVGGKYLKSPTNDAGKELGLTIFSNTLNSGTGYPDPVGVKQMYRYISGTSSPAAGDNPCSFQGEQLKLHYCFLAQVSQDTRYFESSGPFTLSPGQSKTIVVAIMNAPAVNTPYLQTQVGGDFKPGFAATGDSIAKDSTKVRQIERVMGWVTQKDLNSDGIIEENEVTTVRRSLLDKANVAQAVFDAKFLLPFAPASPLFFLIPGDNQVTIVWQKSPSEDPVTGGNPYFAIASDPTNALYDPNFRHFDTEGYRIYRGRTPGALELVAQFDYAGTEMIDYSGSFNWGNCAPELGVNYLTPGNTCPKDVFGNPFKFDSTSIANGIGAPVPLTGNVVQIPAGGRVKLSSGTVLITNADTAVTGGGTGFPALSDNGVGFAYVDRGVRNLFQYFYSVTAFSVNSVRSGPSSLESARATKTVTPRAAGATSASAGQLGATILLNAKGQPLGPGTPPTIDPTTGEFSGPAQPANTVSLGFAAFLPELIDSGTMTIKIDSVLPGQNPVDYGLSIPTTYFVSSSSTGGVSHFAIQIQTDATLTEVTGSGNFTGPSVAHGANYGGDPTFSLAGQLSLSVPGPWRLAGPGRGAANSNPAGSGFTGDRWWGGAANENTPNPTAGMCNGSGGCAVQPNPLSAARLAQTAGSIPGVTIIGAIQAYNTTPNFPLRDMETSTSTVYRAADFALYWGTGGKIDSVVDVTHGVQVPFNSKLRASYGIIDSTSFAGVIDDVDGNPNVLTWGDVMCVDPLNATVAQQFGYGCANPVPMRDTAHLSQISTQFVADSTAANSQAPLVGATQARGFILYLAGKFWAVAMPALPVAGTVWNARYFAGTVTGTSGTYKFVPADRPPAVPGLRAQASYTASAPLDLNHTSQDQLAAVHTVPDPYYVTNALEITPNNKVLKFVNLPPKAIVRIYSVSGILVQVLTHNDPTGGGELDWDLRNRSNQFVASGVYFYHVESADGKTKVGRFTVVQFAP